MKQYEKIGKRRFKIDDLRLILGLTQGEYPLYANFKQKVILKAQKDLETTTNIKFSFDEEKQGKKIDAIVKKVGQPLEGLGMDV
ncbi:MAG: replication initiation protein [Saprospiraceae bacterium]|nr:replication initiation protein [Saprospiraceae bacterium]